jgi:predicted phosphoadenosine phosphosulfate sulfurtransferase
LAGRIRLGKNVFTASIERIRALYANGDKVVVSFSAGKDSGVMVELAVIAATLEKKLPVYVVHRDEEAMFPGTVEYAERIAARPEIEFHWVYAHQPLINVYNRRDPYWFPFDPDLPPEKWMREPPPYGYRIPQLNIEGMATLERFPPGPSGRTVNLIGLRVQESSRRMLGLHSSGGYIGGKSAWGVIGARPIYDWTDGDIWLAINKLGWDYNRAYDVMYKLGMSRSELRIAPPTQSGAGLKSMQLSAKAWPEWFDALGARCPGVEQGVMFGKRWITPHHKATESWQDTFQRENIDDAPDWIKPRAIHVRDTYLERHSHHSSKPFPEVEPCHDCAGGRASWKGLSNAIYLGDCFAMTFNFLDQMEPQHFRPHWAGTPLGMWTWQKRTNRRGW